ncbi:MAG: Rpn family recombination-promoting nuclease/putative transposase [Gammaproteobacteria bacterium]
MSKKNSELVTNPHDQFFRQAMQDKRVATEFLKVHLPADLSVRIDFNTLSLQPRSQTNAVRKESIVDVLFKAKIDGKEAYIYALVEHQSSADPLMALRVIEYTINAIRDHLVHHKTTKIPLIYPLVVYHGRPCKFTTDIRDLVDAPRELVDSYFLKPFQLLDLNQISDADLKKNIWSGVMGFTLKHIFERDMLPFLQEFAPILRVVDQNHGQNYLGLVLQYIVQSAELSDKNAFFELINTHISEETGEKIMTLAEQLKLEGEIRGELKGKLEGKLETAQEMIAQGLDLNLIAKVTHLPIEKIKALKKH